MVLVDGAHSAFGGSAKHKLLATRPDEAGATVILALLDRNPKSKDTMIVDAGIRGVGGKPRG